MRFKRLADWFPWLETLHPRSIDLSLARCLDIAEPHALNQFSIPVVTVAGTNGKGTTIAALSAIYKTAGYRVGSYTSPHLLRFNERICINGEPVADEVICQAFAQIDQWRGERLLTYFEFITLAALAIFQQADLDVLLLEVGLGGRLDAVNVVDSDVAVISSIDLDHCAWLGNDREAIGYEKAGILRHYRPLVFAQAERPQSVTDQAARLHCPIYQYGQDFSVHVEENRTVIHLPEQQPLIINKPQLVPSNLAAAAMVSQLLQQQLPIDRNVLARALNQVQITGRIQQLHSDPQWLLDVAHNPASVQNLSDYLQQQPCSGRTYAVFSMLADKDIEQCLTIIERFIDHWFIAPLGELRGLTLIQLEKAFKRIGITSYQGYDTIGNACRQVRQLAQSGDRVIVFGSFYTVAKVLAL